MVDIDTLVLENNIFAFRKKIQDCRKILESKILEDRLIDSIILKDKNYYKLWEGRKVFVYDRDSTKKSNSYYSLKIIDQYITDAIYKSVKINFFRVVDTLFIGQEITFKMKNDFNRKGNPNYLSSEYIKDIRKKDFAFDRQYIDTFRNIISKSQFWLYDFYSNIHEKGNSSNLEFSYYGYSNLGYIHDYVFFVHGFSRNYIDSYWNDVLDIQKRLIQIPRRPITQYETSVFKNLGMVSEPEVIYPTFIPSSND
ncbi:MAG: hypothetical protein K1X55_06615 [Chitinophagales bacterium]|nr:hypothetical protein [Chitinophagales bacterium]